MTPLNESEARIAQLVAEGLSDKQIAAAVGLSRSYTGQVVRLIARSLGCDPSRNVRTQIAYAVGGWPNDGLNASGNAKGA